MSRTRSAIEEDLAPEIRELMEEVIPELYWGRLSKNGLMNLALICRRQLELEDEVERYKADETSCCWTEEYQRRVKPKKDRLSDILYRFIPWGKRQVLHFGPDDQKVDGYRSTDFYVGYNPHDRTLSVRGGASLFVSAQSSNVFIFGLGKLF